MEQQVESILSKALEDSKYFAAIAAFLGVIVGAVITIGGNILLHVMKNSPIKAKEKKQKEILKIMLGDEQFSDKWRNIETLSRVIGETEQKTKRLLIQINARGSESDGNRWGLIENHPLTKDSN